MHTQGHETRLLSLRSRLLYVRNGLHATLIGRHPARNSPTSPKRRNLGRQLHRSSCLRFDEQKLDESIFTCGL